VSDEATSMHKAARSVIARFLLQGAIFVIVSIGVPLGGWVADRMIKTLDKIVEKQDAVKDEMYRINQAILSIQGDNKLLNNRIDESNRTVNSRLDALSAWTRKNADEIDKVKDWFYRPKQQ
jgi:hypothetical protein